MQQIKVPKKQGCYCSDKVIQLLMKLINEDNIPKIIEVSVQTDPPIVKANQLTIIQAKVT